MKHAALHEFLASVAPALRDHLVSSTVLLVALMGVSLLPFVRARTRHALTFLGLLSFLLPGSVVAGLLAALEVPVASLPSFTLTAFGSSAPSPLSELFCVLAVVWAAGACAVTVRRFADHARWSRILRGAGEAPAREVEAMRRVVACSALRSTPRLARTAAATPMTGGVLRPVVFLPQSAETLDDAELTAVLAHELTHVERRHNLATIVRGVVTALFWFHPVLWLATSRLHAEAEKDCDERALRFVSDPPTYFSGISKVCHGFIAPQPAGVSCMSTTQLKERMDHLMKQHRSNRRSVPHRLALATAIAALFLTTIFASAGTRAGDKVSIDDPGVTRPKLVRKVEPAYPESARKAKLEGIVIVVAEIDAKGNVTAVAVAQGIEGAEGEALEESALAAVRQWKFEPARKDGEPVAVTFKVTIRFRLGK